MTDTNSNKKAISTVGKGKDKRVRTSSAFILKICLTRLIAIVKLPGKIRGILITFAPIFTKQMAESITIVGNSKEEKYKSLLPQVKALTEGEKDLVANLSNMMAALKQAMDFFWVGVYLVKDNQLVLGPFQGPVACTRIQLGKGVCGTAWEQGKTIIVEDVDKFPGHIACSSLSRSEIVVPVFDTQGKVSMIIDVDSAQLADFDMVDARFLEEIALHIQHLNS